MLGESNEVNSIAQEAATIRKDSRASLTEWLEQFWGELSECYWELPDNEQSPDSFRKDLEKKIWESIRVFDSESSAQLCSIIYPLTTEKLRKKFVSEHEFARAFLPKFEQAYLNADPAGLETTRRKGEELAIALGTKSMASTIEHIAKSERHNSCLLYTSPSPRD